MENFKQIIKGNSEFAKAFEKWQSQEPQISDAAEPDFCECGNQISLDPDSMEPGVIYCDRSYQYVKNQKERTYKNEAREISYIPKQLTFNSIGRCPAPEQKRKEEQIKKLETFQTFDTFDSLLQPIAFNTCKNFDGSGKLILAGKTGVGKTHLARASYLNILRIKNCIWFNAPELAELFRRIQSFNDDWKDRQSAQSCYEFAIKCHCVFIDDLGCERVTESDLFKEEFKSFLENIKGGLVVTTNFDNAALAERYGEKITSRLLENADVIVMSGENYRRRSLEIISGKMK